MGQNSQIHLRSGKSDVIEGIILGNKQINAFNKLDNKKTKPSEMIKRLTVIADNSSDKKIVQHATKAIKELKKITNDDPLTEEKRINLLKVASKP